MYLCFVMCIRVGGGSCMFGLFVVYYNWFFVSCWWRKVIFYFFCKFKYCFRSFRDIYVRLC